MTPIDHTRFIREHPRPVTARESLLHTLEIYAGMGDDTTLVTATTGIYGKGAVTGLTLGDLRKLAQPLDDDQITRCRDALAKADDAINMIMRDERWRDGPAGVRLADAYVLWLELGLFDGIRQLPEEN